MHQAFEHLSPCKSSPFLARWQMGAQIQRQEACILEQCIFASACTWNVGREERMTLNGARSLLPSAAFVCPCLQLPVLFLQLCFHRSSVPASKKQITAVLTFEG